MSREHVARYRLILDELVAERQQAGGKLSDDREWELIVRLDRAWHEMSEEEQEAFDREVACRLRSIYCLSQRWLRKRVELPRWGWILLSIVVGCSVGAMVQ